jgi:hypothetical protein
MQPQAALHSRNYVWSVLAPRFSAGLKARAWELWRLSGLDEEYGPLGENFTGERETQEMSDEIAGYLVNAMALDTQARQAADRTDRGVGRPRDVIIPYLGPNLLSFFLRCHDSAGRQSVLTSIAGQLAQMETGPFFNFVKTAIEPLNEVLVTELHRKPVSAARLARYALKERRHNLSAARRRQRH